jgi:hypothetical protein
MAHKKCPPRKRKKNSKNIFLAHMQILLKFSGDVRYLDYHTIGTSTTSPGRSARGRLNTALMKTGSPNL